jgi:hypothetical protein
MNGAAGSSFGDDAMSTDNSPDLLAWIGEDEFGSGKIGIKQAVVPAGYIPLAALQTDQEKITRDLILAALQAQANVFGKTIRLVRYRAIEDVITLTPKGATR